MLNLAELRKAAHRSGARDIGNIEIDVILTQLDQWAGKLAQVR